MHLCVEERVFTLLPIVSIRVGLILRGNADGVFADRPLDLLCPADRTRALGTGTDTCAGGGNDIRLGPAY
jgi:hypothetical protein